MNQEEEIKKQKLLIAEIIEQGYDQDEFEGYLNQIAPEKTDLEQWTFQDLQIICTQFSRGKFKQDDKKHDGVAFKVSKIFKPISLMQAKKQININDTFIEEFYETVPCRKEKYYIEKGQILQFEIETIKAGFKITTKPYGWEVRRQLADFKQLQELLMHLNPEIIMSNFLFEETPQPTDLIQTLKDFLNQFNKQERFRTQIISYYFLNEVKPPKSFIETANQLKKTPSYSLQNKQSPKEVLDVKLTQESFLKYQQMQHYAKNFATQSDFVEKQIKKAIGKIELAEESLNQVAQELSPLLELKPFEELKQTNYQKQFASKAIIFITEFQETIKKTKQNFEDTFNQILSEMNENHQAQVQTIENCQEIQKIFLQHYKKFMNTQPTLLQKIEIQEVLNKQEHIKKVNQSGKIHISNIEYEKLCLILRQELPLQVPNEFEEQQQKKLEFAYMIQETCAGVKDLDKEDTVRFSKILDQAIREIISECDRRKQNAENILGIEEYQ